MNHRLERIRNYECTNFCRSEYRNLSSRNPSGAILFITHMSNMYVLLTIRITITNLNKLPKLVNEMSNII